MGIQPIFSAGNISILTAGVNLRHFTNRSLAPSQILESQYQLLRTVHFKLRNIFLKFPQNTYSLQWQKSANTNIKNKQSRMTNAHMSRSSSKNSPKKLVFLAGSYFYGNIYKSQLICST